MDDKATEEMDIKAIAESRKQINAALEIVRLFIQTSQLKGHPTQAESEQALNAFNWVFGGYPYIEGEIRKLLLTRTIGDVWKAAFASDDEDARSMFGCI